MTISQYEKEPPFCLFTVQEIRMEKITYAIRRRNGWEWTVVGKTGREHRLELTPDQPRADRVFRNEGEYRRAIENAVAERMP